MANAENPDFGAKLKAELFRDKKKLAIMCVLVGICAVMVVRAVIKMKPSPAVAAASPTSTDLTSATPEQQIASGSDETASQHPAEQNRRQEYLTKMDRTIRRDLFRPNLEAFPTSGTLSEVDIVSVASTGAEGPGYLGEMAQLLCDQQMVQRDQIERVNTIRIEARALTLQSTIMGSCPTALVNGQVLCVGDSINRFNVQSISPTACVVSREGMVIEVPMTKERR